MTRRTNNVTLCGIYKLAEQKQIPICDVDLLGCKSLAIKRKNGYAVGIDKRELHSEGEELVCITHEMGHGETGSFYNAANILDVYEKRERQANCWAIRLLLPKETLERAVADGNREIWQLSEYFDYPEWFVKMAVCYHNGLDW